MTVSKIPSDESPAVATASVGPSGLLHRVPGFGRPSPRFVFAWLVALLIANIGLVVTGGAVRLTSSGLGCPTWPRCTDDSFVPRQALGAHGAIEFGNRMLTWVLTVVAIAAFVAVLRSARATRRDKWLVTLLVLGIPFQGVIGGITVLTKLNPWAVSLHFVLSMALVSGATVLAYWMRPRGPSVGLASSAAALGRVLGWVQYLVTCVVIYLGTVVTGSGPHAGDAKAKRNGLDPAQVTQVHAAAVCMLVGIAVAITVLTHVLRLRTQRRTADVFVGLIVVQAVLGVVQYNTGLPIALVIAHMGVSALLLVGATRLVLEFRDADERPRVRA